MRIQAPFLLGMILFQLSGCGLSEFPTKQTSSGSSDPAAVEERNQLGLGSAALLDAGTNANQVVQLDSNGFLPELDASRLINVQFALAANSCKLAAAATTATNASFATNAGNAATATNAATANYATNAGTATYANTATFATSASTATNAGFATNAGNASTANYATSAGTATSASTATSAGFATVAAGAADPSQISINNQTISFSVPIQYNYFDVSGGGNVIAINTASAGTRVTLHFLNNPVLYSGAAGGNLVLSGGGSYQVASDDIFEFVYSNQGVWREVNRIVSKDSYVLAYAPSTGLNPGVAGSMLVLSYPASVDYQSEYYANGYYVARQNGTYQVSAQIGLAGSWVSGDTCTLQINKASTLIAQNNSPAAVGTSGNCTAQASASVHLNAGDTIWLWAWYSSGSHSTAGSQSQTYLSIARVQK